MAVRTILILGGYGNFGKRIAENLSNIPELKILIAGRDIKKAEKVCQELQVFRSKALLEPVVIDVYKANFIEKLEELSPDLLIHTAGPFQGQDYRVPKACIHIGCHYIDLSDDRRFVCDIATLNEAAKLNNVLIVSGASSVPGLSSTVIDHFKDAFSVIDKIDFAIAPGNKAERGEATVKGILSYTGHPFKVFHHGKWINQYGWMSPRKLNFGKVIGNRWLANIDIPDLEIFPERYKPVSTVKFQAGLELPFLHFGMVLMAKVAKIGLVKNWANYSQLIFKSSEILKRFGTDTGGMQINITGLDENQKSKKIKWNLLAKNNAGPFIPTISAIIIAKKLISEEITIRGSTPCLGLFNLDEFDSEANKLGIQHKTEVIHG